MLSDSIPKELKERKRSRLANIDCETSRVRRNPVLSSACAAAYLVRPADSSTCAGVSDGSLQASANPPLVFVAVGCQWSVEPLGSAG